MKILHLNKAYYPHLGGVETIVRVLARAAIKEGHEVCVLCFASEASRENIEGVDVFRVSPCCYIGSAPISMRYLSEFRRLFEKADLIHVHSPHPMGEIAGLLWRNSRKIWLCSYQGDAVRPKWLLPAYRHCQRRFMRTCGNVVTTCPPMLESSRVLAGLPVRPHVIPLGIPVERFRESNSCASYLVPKEVYALPRPRILFIGRMVYYKGIEILLRALVHLPGVSCILVGEGPLEKDIDTQILQYELKERVIRLPHQSEQSYPAVFHEADIFVLPSLFTVEAFGIVVIEAMAAGLPVVTTALGTGTSFTNRHNETGLVVPPENVSALADALRFLIYNPDKRKHMGESAQKRAELLFDEKEMSRSYMNLYRELVKKQTR